MTTLIVGRVRLRPSAARGRLLPGGEYGGLELELSDALGVVPGVDEVLLDVGESSIESVDASTMAAMRRDIPLGGALIST